MDNKIVNLFAFIIIFLMLFGNCDAQWPPLPPTIPPSDAEIGRKLTPKKTRDILDFSILDQQLKQIEEQEKNVNAKYDRQRDSLYKEIQDLERRYSPTNYFKYEKNKQSRLKQLYSNLQVIEEKRTQELEKLEKRRQEVLKKAEGNPYYKKF